MIQTTTNDATYQCNDNIMLKHNNNGGADAPILADRMHIVLYADEIIEVHLMVSAYYINNITSHIIYILCLGHCGKTDKIE